MVRSVLAQIERARCAMNSRLCEPIALVGRGKSFHEAYGIAVGRDIGVHGGRTAAYSPAQRAVSDLLRKFFAPAERREQKRNTDEANALNKYSAACIAEKIQIASKIRLSESAHYGLLFSTRQ